MNINVGKINQNGSGLVNIGTTYVNSTINQPHDHNLQHKEPPKGERYILDPKKPGQVLIINCEFDSEDFRYENNNPNNKQLPKRNGTAVDVKAIKNLFEKMGCKVFIVNNLKYENWEKDLTRFKKQCAERSSSFIAVFVLTHGGEGYKVYTDDGVPIDLFRDVVYPFNNTNFSEYKGNPKLFFIQACNGNGSEVTLDTATDSGVSSSTVVETDQTGQAMTKEVLGVLEDVFVGRASIPLATASRNTETGSPYIQAISEVFGKYWESKDLVSMHKSVELRTKDSVQQTANHTLYDFSKLFFFPDFSQRFEPTSTQ